MAKTRSRRRTHHKRTMPSVAIATYQRLIKLAGTAAVAEGTTLTTTKLAQVSNLSGETVNRKILRISGELCFSAALAAGQSIVAMFCHRASPSLDDWPSVPDFDPFNDGPGTGSGYEGRPSPRPFGRKMFALNVPTSGAVQTLTSVFRYHTKAERLLRPGWELEAGLYVRASAGLSYALTGLTSSVVAD